MVRVTKKEEVAKRVVVVQYGMEKDLHFVANHCLVLYLYGQNPKP